MTESENHKKMSGDNEKTPASQERDEIYEIFLAVLDFLFSVLVITPAVVGCWRSMWELMDFYCYPNDKVLSASISTTIGFCGNLILNFIQHPMDETFHPDTNRILYYVVSRTYSVIYAFVCVNWFRGVWQLLDVFMPGDVGTTTFTTVSGIVILMLFRSLRNTAAPPIVVASDERDGYFQVLTIFRISSSEKRNLYILDCIFSTAFIGTLVVSVWRGGFLLLDLLVYPEDRLHSYWTTMIFGYGVITIAFLLQTAVQWICARLPIIPRLLVGDLFLIFAGVGTINIWRGMWDLINYYYLPNMPELSNWSVYWTSLIILILLGCSNSLLVRGVFIDAEEPGGDSMIFPCHFIRNILQEQRRQKTSKKLKRNEADNSRELEEKSNKGYHNSTFVHDNEYIA